MKITCLNPDAYEYESTTVDTSEEEHISLWKLPKLFWAGTALFVINTVIAIGMLITPNMETDVYGHEVAGVYAVSSKPSPFTEVVDISKHKVHLAAKLRPVLLYPAPVNEQFDGTSAAVSASYQLSQPLRTEPAIYPGSGMQQSASPGSYDMPRASYMPARTEPALHQSGVDVTLRRTSEKEKFVVIN